MLRRLARTAVFTILIAATAVQAQTTQTQAFGWENTAFTVLGVHGTALTENVTAPDPVRTGERSLRLMDNHSGGDTPQAYVAWIQGLQAGDQITARVWFHDTTSGSPSGRIWAHYNDSLEDVMGYNGSAGGPGVYSSPTGWTEMSHTWTMADGHTGLVIEIRTYSDGNDTIWADDLSVIAPATASISFPGDVIKAKSQTIITATGTGNAVITLSTEGASTFTYNITGLQPVLPTIYLNDCRLFDASNNADRTAGGALAGDQVRFQVGGSGLYRFTFTASNGIDVSLPATILLGVQKLNSVIITEIMHRPNNHTSSGDDQYSPWEWLEVKNISGTEVLLDSIQTPSTLDVAYYNLDGPPVPAGAMRIVMSHATANAFLAEWNSPWRPAAALTSDDLALVRTDLGYTKPSFLDEDTLFLFDWDTNELLDAVTYKNGKDGWPTFEDGASFFLEHGKYSTTDNDDGANWKCSLASANNTYQTNETFGGELDVDLGSPLLAPAGPTLVPSDAPHVYAVIGDDDAVHPIALRAIPAAASYTILSLPMSEAPTSGSGGTLSDPAGGAIIAAPYTLADGGAVVNLTPSAAGVFRFQYRATDSAGVVSNVANVVLYVQAVDRVVVTEVMYNPDNEPDRDWQWIEIYSLTSQSVSLGSLVDLYHYPQYVGNLAGATISPNQIKLIAPDATERGRAGLLAEWTRPAGYPFPAITEADVIWVDPARWPALDTGGGFRLYAADGTLLDAVDYLKAAPWPTVDGSESIALSPTQLGSVANDSGANWVRSTNNEYLAYTTPEDTAIPGFDTDIGSPLVLPMGFPATQGASLSLAGGPATVPITLAGSDPTSDPLRYVVGALIPVAPTMLTGDISLTDPNNGHAAVTGGGILAGHTGRVDLNLDGSTTGTFKFTFRVNDGVRQSNNSTIWLFVQGGSVIITEIMYDPSNTPDGDWEWVEIANLTGSPVALGSLQDAAREAVNNNNLAGLTIPANGLLVLAKGGVLGDITGGRSGADFLTDWAPLTGDKVVWIANWPALGNEGDSVLLYDASGGLLDGVEFLADGVVWPASADPLGSESIYLEPGQLTATANDSPAGWALSVAGVDSAYATPETPGGYEDSDVGSPGLPVSLPLVFDFNGDGVVDRIDDLPVFAGCAVGPSVAHNGTSACQWADYDDDSDVDSADFAAFQRCLQPATQTPMPGCAR
jgi:hypothetical protein